MKLSVALSIVEKPDGLQLEARLTNTGDLAVAVEEVFLCIGGPIRSRRVSSDQWQVAGVSFDTPFVVDASLTIAAGRYAVVILPPASAKGLHLLSSHINEDVAIRVSGAGGTVARFDDDSIRATVARLMELQNPTVKTRLKRQILAPRLKRDADSGKK